MAKRTNTPKKSKKKVKKQEQGEDKSKGKVGAILASAGALLSVVVSATVIGLNLSTILENFQNSFRSRERLEISCNDAIVDSLLPNSEFELAEERRDLEIEIDRRSLFQFTVTNRGARRDSVIVGIELPESWHVGGFGVVEAKRGVRLDTLPYLEQKGKITRRASTRILEFPNDGEIRMAVWVTTKHYECDSVECRLWTAPAAWDGIFVCTVGVRKDTFLQEIER